MSPRSYRCPIEQRNINVTVVPWQAGLLWGGLCIASGDRLLPPCSYHVVTRYPRGIHEGCTRYTRGSASLSPMYIAWCCAEPASELLAPWKWRELSSPSPGPLPKGEGELSAAWRQIEASRQLARRTTEHPLTGGVAEAKPDSRISVTPAARRSRKPEDRRSKAERRPK